MKKHPLSIKERVRKYVVSLKKNGKFRPGEKLPSHHDLKEKFGVSYASIQTALNALERGGVIEKIQGSGTFLSGAKPLPIDLYVDLNVFTPQRMKPIIDDFIHRQGIFVDVAFKDIRQRGDLRNIRNSKRVAIVQKNRFYNLDAGSLLDLTQFKDYPTVCSVLKDMPNPNRNVVLPLYIYSHQAGVNPRILASLGLSADQADMTTEWWADYVARCKAAGRIPAYKPWMTHALWSIDGLLTMFYQLICNETGSPDCLGQLPLFHTESGRRFLKILSDHTTMNPSLATWPSFYTRDCGVDVNLGSWICVQYQDRFGLQEDEIRIIPYHLGAQRICHLTFAGLAAFVYGSINEDEKQRVWALMKLLVSRKCQLELAATGGIISVRRDIAPTEHPWNSRPDFASFFPSAKDVIIYDVFSTEVIAALSTLYEQVELFGADVENVLQSMDAKVRSQHEFT